MDSTIYHADYLFLGDETLLKDAWLRLNQHGRILEISEGSIEDPNLIKIEGAISPSFINCHCHLELSHLHQKVEMHGGLHEFIPSLQEQRRLDQKSVKKAIERWDQKMWENGIAAVGDITNGIESLTTKKRSSIHYHNFIELFGLKSGKAKAIYTGGVELMAKFSTEGQSASLVPHSPYAVSDPLFQMIAQASHGKIISIHNQETPGEKQMFEKGTGPLLAMLEKFGNDALEMKKEISNSLLHALQFFSEEQKVLLVHNTFSDENDLRAALETHANLFWCFCPQANWYIEKKLPNIPLFVENNLKCTLGTDSLASNHDLSILSEIQLIKQHYPEIKSKTLISWACRNGAEFLELDQLGMLEVGKVCGLNQISNLTSEAEISPDSRVKRLL